MTDPRSRAGETKKLQTRAAIISAGETIIDPKDRRQFSVSEIAQLSGKSPAAFYNHFETLNDLVDEIVAYRAQAFQDKADQKFKLRFDDERINMTWTWAKGEILSLRKVLAGDYSVNVTKYLRVPVVSALLRKWPDRKDVHELTTAYHLNACIGIVRNETLEVAEHVLRQSGFWDDVVSRVKQAEKTDQYAQEFA